MNRPRTVRTGEPMNWLIRFLMNWTVQKPTPLPDPVPAQFSLPSCSRRPLFPALPEAQCRGLRADGSPLQILRSPPLPLQILPLSLPLYPPAVAIAVTAPLPSCCHRSPSFPACIDLSLSLWDFLYIFIFIYFINLFSLLFILFYIFYFFNLVIFKIYYFNLN